jgi:hypothetical protein
MLKFPLQSSEGFNEYCILSCDLLILHAEDSGGTGR